MAKSGQLGQSVSNEQGLVAVGSSDYRATTASGSASAGTAGWELAGSLKREHFGEYSNLIIAQRAFEANLEGRNNLNTVTQDTINMIH